MKIAKLTFALCFLTSHAIFAAEPDGMKLKFLSSSDLSSKLKIVRDNYKLTEVKSLTYSQAQIAISDTLQDISIYGGKTAKTKGEFNAEHVIPQSRFQGQDMTKMKSDLHHVFGCVIFLNNARANFKFQDIDDEKAQFLDTNGQKVARSKDDKKTISELYNQTFEPNELSKGNIARACAYFFTRYPDSIKFMSQVIDISTMLKWHESDPVNAEEKKREDLVFKLQGNHNPYIALLKIIGTE